MSDPVIIDVPLALLFGIGLGIICAEIFKKHWTSKVAVLKHWASKVVVFTIAHDRFELAWKNSLYSRWLVSISILKFIMIVLYFWIHLLTEKLITPFSRLNLSHLTLHMRLVVIVINVKGIIKLFVLVYELGCVLRNQDACIRKCLLLFAFIILNYSL